jgi:DNA-binding transcriptional ArsR family regulator
LPAWWSDAGVYHHRVPDLRSEVVRLIGAAGTTWHAHWYLCREQERCGRNASIRQAASRGILLDVGVKGIARAAGLHPQTVGRHLRRLEELGLIAVVRPAVCLIRDRLGRLRTTQGRGEATVIRATISADHLRPGGRHRETECTLRGAGLRVHGADAFTATSINSTDTPTDRLQASREATPEATPPEAGRQAGREARPPQRPDAGLGEGVSVSVGGGGNAVTGSGTGGPEPEPEPAGGDRTSTGSAGTVSGTTMYDRGGRFIGDTRMRPGETLQAFRRRLRQEESAAARQAVEAELPAEEVPPPPEDPIVPAYSIELHPTIVGLQAVIDQRREADGIRDDDVDVRGLEELIGRIRRRDRTIVTREDRRRQWIEARRPQEADLPG